MKFRVSGFRNNLEGKIGCGFSTEALNYVFMLLVK